MPRDDEGDRVFDVSKPGKTSPTPTSKPIIVGHHPMMSDPMVKDDREDKAEHAAMPKSSHKTIPIQSEHHEEIKPEVHSGEVKPDEPVQHDEPEPAEHVEVHAKDVSTTLVPAAIEAQPQHPESVAAVASPQGDPLKMVAAESAANDMHLTSIDDLIGHDHHSHEHHTDNHEHSNVNAQQNHKAPGKKSKKSTWLLLLLLVIIAGYLAIDSRLIKTSIKLPFHVFKQPTPAAAPVASPQQSAGSIATTAPPTGLTAYKITTTADKTVSFNYPTTWGTPIETTDPGFSSRSKTAKSDGTYAYLINFTTNKDVQIALTSGKYLPAARTPLYYDYLQWCVGTNDGKFYKSELNFSTSAGVDTPTTTTCDQGPLTDATKLDSATIIQLKTTAPDGSLLGDLYTENLDDELNLPVLRVKDSAMTNSVAIKALLASLKLIENQSTPASE